MNIATLAPYLITYLCGCLTSILLVFRTPNDRQNGSGCVHLFLLLGVLFAIGFVIYLWVTAPVSSLG